LTTSLNEEIHFLAVHVFVGLKIIFSIFRLVLLAVNKIKISRAIKKISKIKDAVTEIESVSKTNEKKVSISIATDKNKSNSDSALDDQYTSKVLLYGYISVN
jgi:hypothetical protein